MTRKVYDNAMVAHVWAQQTQDEGRSNNGQFYFTGPRIYSYGSHFVAGVFDAEGRAWINADSYSPTTGKHMSYVRRAISGRYFSIPSLTGIYRAIEDMGDASRAAWVKRELESYFKSTWESFPADSEAAAILWSHVSPRGTWKAERARRDAKAAKAKARNEANAKRYARESAAAFAKVPLDMIRARMIQVCSGREYERERNAAGFVAELYEAHRGAGGKLIRAAVWERLKLARALRTRLVTLPGKYADCRKALATLRRIWAGDYGLQIETGGLSARINAGITESQAIGLLLRDAPGLRASLRARMIERERELDSIVAELTREREAERMAEQAAERAAWLANSPDAPRYAYQLKDERGGALIRATGVEMDGCTVTGGTLETSQGATVPLRHAARVFAFVRAIRERGESWQKPFGKPGVRVGHFQLDSVAASGDFVAGCHVINWNETERLARELGLWDCPATALIGPDDEAEAA